MTEQRYDTDIVIAQEELMASGYFRNQFRASGWTVPPWTKEEAEERERAGRALDALRFMFKAKGPDAPLAR